METLPPAPCCHLHLQCFACLSAAFTSDKHHVTTFAAAEAATSHQKRCQKTDIHWIELPPLYLLEPAASCVCLIQVLIDVGAGNGFFSLAAAARGHRAVAFEMSNRSVASFEASIADNGFEKAIALHKASYSCPPVMPGL